MRHRAILSSKLTRRIVPPEFRRLILSAEKQVVSVPVDRLAYAEIGRFVLPDMTASQESDLFDDRLQSLITAREELFTHHDMGNYVASVDKL